MNYPGSRIEAGIRAIYYGILLVFSVWGVFVIRLASPFTLFKILANMAGIVLMIGGIQIFLVNRRFLPRAVRPPLWREAALLACSAFYAFFAFRREGSHTIPDALSVRIQREAIQACSSRVA